MALQGKPTYAGRPTEAAEKFHMGLLCHGCSRKACTLRQAQRTTRELPHGSSLPWSYKGTTHPGRPTQPPERLHVGLLCNGSARQAHTPRGIQGDSKRGVFGSPWRPKPCQRLLEKGCLGKPPAAQTMPKAIRKRASLKAPGGPNHAKGNSKKGVFESPSRPHMDHHKADEQPRQSPAHKHPRTSVIKKKGGAGGPVAQRSGNGGRSFNNPHEQPRRPSMHKHPKTSVIESNPRAPFGPTPALSVSRVRFFSIACVRGPFVHSSK